MGGPLEDPISIFALATAVLRARSACSHLETALDLKAQCLHTGLPLAGSPMSLLLLLLPHLSLHRLSCCIL